MSKGQLCSCRASSSCILGDLPQIPDIPPVKVGWWSCRQHHSRLLAEEGHGEERGMSLVSPKLLFSLELQIRQTWRSTHRWPSCPWERAMTSRGACAGEEVRTGKHRPGGGRLLGTLPCGHPRGGRTPGLLGCSPELHLSLVPLTPSKKSSCCFLNPPQPGPAQPFPFGEPCH